MAFSKTKADARKEWLAGYQPGVWVDNNKSAVGIEEFINKELVLFSMEDNARSIPSVVDGLKPGQRKILWTALEANLKSEMKVVSLQGKVTEKAMYHHGDQSLVATIVNMAQDFVGSNNINLLMPEGSFGTRLAGGKDAASARYIATYLNKITRAIFCKHDDPLLDNLNDDGKMVEPRWYVPVIPMVLVNGAEGIGTGWSTTIPNYSPTDIIANIRRLMRAQPLEPMKPWYRGFRGSIEQGEPGRFRTLGTVTKLSDTELHISELPIRVWTDTYKGMLNKWMAGEKGGPLIRDFRYNASTLTVDITLTLTLEQMAAAEAAGFDKHFKLSSTIPTTNMVCFDREGRLRRFTSAEEIIDDFYPLRLRYYQLRKENMAEKLGRDLQMADNRARFVMEIIQKKLVVNNRKRVEITNELRDRGYAAMPKPAKAAVSGDPDSEEQADTEAEASDYDYLLSMPIWNLTMEKVEKLLKEKNEIQKKLEDLLALTPIDLWTADLDEVEKQWDVMVAEYEQRLVDDEMNRKGQGAGGSGSGGKGRGRGKAGAATARKPAAKRKSDPLLKEEIKELGQPVPKARKTGGTASMSKVKVELGTPKISAASTPTAVPTPTPTPTPAANTLGSDLEDSDEDVATTIFKKAAAKKQGGEVKTVKQTTLGSMLARKAESNPAPAAKPAAAKPKAKPAAKATSAKPVKRASKKMAISDSEDDGDSGDGGFVDSDSDSDGGDDVAPPPPRQAAGRRAAATAKKPVYMDVSDDSDDDFEM
ncbi:DNA topoisomerase 2 [Coemansia erecta]|nr:DNA topoisomerase 2 [Coemansia erecta]